MADAVTASLIENGNRNWAYVFTSLSDGTGETGVTKVDGSSAGPLGVPYMGQTFYPGTHIRVREIEWNVKGMALEIYWDATTPTNLAVLGGDTAGRMDWDLKLGGVKAVGSNNAVLTGATGKIKFTTLGAMPNSGYTVYIRGTKGVQF